MGLVVSRREGEGLIIGDDIKITPVALETGFVRLHIEAPKDVEISREETYERVTGKELKDFQINSVKSSKK
ncbi:carbon storage regulator [Alteribacillus iranensis]|uniref:Translational regulator CsrA n=1 Tax=Alteribacillus iranensis TaxID=930128 RepID=A0A1I2BFZ7_9BACI|nr:carbon storage regulator [Alteribacillus iranensis]SFE55075.1 carbon storage regulator, CsrA [Alteribacillus iranensis]